MKIGACLYVPVFINEMIQVFIHYSQTRAIYYLPTYKINKMRMPPQWELNALPWKYRLPLPISTNTSQI